MGQSRYLLRTLLHSQHLRSPCTALCSRLERRYLGAKTHKAPSSRSHHRSEDPKTKPFSEFLTDKVKRQHDYLRISITERCNLRCVYCMPETGVALSPPPHLLTTPEIIYLSSLFVSQGVTKIRITGGEPTVRPDFLSLMQEIGKLRQNGLRELCLTSNGLTLGPKLDSLVEAGLTGVNISLDTLDPFQFQIMTRRKGFERVRNCIQQIVDMNHAGANVKLKINCVVVRGLNDGQIIPFLEFCRDHPVEVRFIEYMPFDGNRWNREKLVSYQEMRAIIEAKFPLRKLADHENDTSKTFQPQGFRGRVGFITSLTDNFCGTCNRLRVTADGSLKVCLFGNSEVSLRDLIRRANNGLPWESGELITVSEIADNEQSLLEVIGMAVKRKKPRHAGIGQLEKMENRPMILIGG
ncbi:hypothetical protein BDV59DRAFT_183229 [Aspergillus ambiguus]|uniref:uncharacterized protein n=1 Tax=Aspergillus ambiguus TaxID=176160 RepID=UPI003CCCB6E1